jgi:hypothetical protein
MPRSCFRPRQVILASLGVVATVAVAVPAHAQAVVYRPVVPMFAPAAGPYVANYSPVGNYAAVTAFSPPVVQGVPMAAVAMPVVETVPTSSLGNSGYSPLALSPLPSGVVAAPAAAMARTTFYAPSYAAAPAYGSTVGYSPAVFGPTVVGPTVFGPTVVTAGYAPAVVPAAVPVAPAAVVVPLRRGLFGGLRPMRSGYLYPAW